MGDNLEFLKIKIQIAKYPPLLTCDMKIEFQEIPYNLQNKSPSEEEINDYLKWLGGDLIEDQDLNYIAREGLMAPIPPGWKLYQRKDGMGEPFYFNYQTGESTIVQEKKERKKNKIQNLNSSSDIPTFSKFWKTSIASDENSKSQKTKQIKSATAEFYSIDFDFGSDASSSNLDENGTIRSSRTSPDKKLTLSDDSDSEPKRKSKQSQPASSPKSEGSSDAKNKGNINRNTKKLALHDLESDPELFDTKPKLKEKSKSVSSKLRDSETNTTPKGSMFGRDSAYLEHIRFLEDRLRKYENVFPFDPSMKKQRNFSDDQNEHGKSENFIIDSIDEKHQKMIEKIGEGATSVVYKVVDERNNRVICKKVLKSAAFKDLQNTLKEFEVLLKLNHPCICECVGMNPQEKEATNNDKSEGESEDEFIFEEDEVEKEKVSKKKEITTVALFLK